MTVHLDISDQMDSSSFPSYVVTLPRRPLTSLVSSRWPTASLMSIPVSFLCLLACCFFSFILISYYFSFWNLICFFNLSSLFPSPGENMYLEHFILSPNLLTSLLHFSSSYLFLLSFLRFLRNLREISTISLFLSV